LFAVLWTYFDLNVHLPDGIVSRVNGSGSFVSYKNRFSDTIRFEHLLHFILILQAKSSLREKKILIKSLWNDNTIYKLTYRLPTCLLTLNDVLGEAIDMIDLVVVETRVEFNNPNPISAQLPYFRRGAHRTKLFPFASQFIGVLSRLTIA
jgi:hypothetical protein